MNKVQLTSLVRSIAKRKLMEIGERPKPAMGKPISSINWGGAPKSASKRQHGLVVGQEGGEPMIQVVGYGVAKLSSVKKSIADRIEVLAKEAKVGNFKNIEHDLHPDGVLVLFVKALNEVEEQLKSKGTMKENQEIPQGWEDAEKNPPEDDREVQVMWDDGSFGPKSIAFYDEKDVIPSDGKKCWWVYSMSNRRGPTPVSPGHVKAWREVHQSGSVKEDMTTSTSSTNSTGVTDPNAPETTTPAEPQEPQMSDLDAKALQTAQADQTKLTSDRDRLRGALAKLQEPIIKKTKDAQRKMADIEKKLGNASKKIQDIQAKYKTNENELSERIHQKTQVLKKLAKEKYGI